MSTREYPSIDYVRQLFDYRDGKLFWKPRPREHFRNQQIFVAWNTKYAGIEAGCIQRTKGSYRRRLIGIDGNLYRRFLVVWAIHHGEWRTGLDHENRNSLDDRIENLRPATQSQNNANIRRPSNNTSGFKGVNWMKQKKKWRARIKVHRKEIYLGSYDTPEQAAAAYIEAARKHFGEFACEG